MLDLLFLMSNVLVHIIYLRYELWPCALACEDGTFGVTDRGQVRNHLFELGKAHCVNVLVCGNN